MGYIPFWHIEVELPSEEEAFKSEGGIYLPTESKNTRLEQASCGTVVQIGATAARGHKNIDPNNLRVKVGDRVLFAKWTGVQLPLKGKKNHRLINDDEILYVLSDDDQIDLIG